MPISFNDLVVQLRLATPNFLYILNTTPEKTQSGNINMSKNISNFTIKFLIVFFIDIDFNYLLNDLLFVEKISLNYEFYLFY